MLILECLPALQLVLTIRQSLNDPTDGKTGEQLFPFGDRQAGVNGQERSPELQQREDALERIQTFIAGERNQARGLPSAAVFVEQGQRSHALSHPFGKLAEGNELTDIDHR
jgi:hypothetical protein